MPIFNSYQAYNTDGPGGSLNTTDLAGSFAYWTDPVFDEASPPSLHADTNPNMVYAPVPPGPFKDPETADYVGIAVHCAGTNANVNRFCSTAQGNRGNETTPSPTASPDLLPDEPGGYSGYQALFGHRYVAPQLGAGTPNLSSHGVPVTNAQGNLTDENGNQINGAFLTPPAPGFPGFSNINASQTLAYMADMLESGVPVVNGYISDIHGNEHIPELTGTGAPCHGAPSALGSGTACYIAQAQYYNTAFGIFFQRLAADGITPANTEFIVSSDEGDHEAGANVGRALQPSPPNCDGAKVSGDTVTPDVLCTYPPATSTEPGTFGELAGNITGLLATEKNNTTPFSLENDTAPEFYVTGNPDANAPTVRTLERDVAGLTASNPYAGAPNQLITNYIADPVEEAILHMVNADPARTPTFALFGRPDYFWTNGGTTGTWVDETDIRPTLMYLTGLKDDYIQDGRVISEILTNPNSALSAPGVESLGACYKQLNSSVGQFGDSALRASTAAVESSTPGDGVFKSTNAKLSALEKQRDMLAITIKDDLNSAAFGNQTINGGNGLTTHCGAIIAQAANLARSA
jgi:hypothetical protein